VPGRRALPTAGYAGGEFSPPGIPASLRTARITYTPAGSTTTAFTTATAHTTDDAPARTWLPHALRGSPPSDPASPAPVPRSTPAGRTSASSPTADAFPPREADVPASHQPGGGEGGSKGSLSFLPLRDPAATGAPTQGPTAPPHHRENAPHPSTLPARTAASAPASLPGAADRSPLAPAFDETATEIADEPTAKGMALVAGPNPAADGGALPPAAPQPTHTTPGPVPTAEAIERWTERAAEALRSDDSRRPDTLEATLDDPRLGRVRVQVRRTHDAVAVRVEVTDNALAGATEHRLEQLRRELRQGFDGPVSVDVFAGGRGDDDGRSRKPTRPSRDPHPRTADPAPSEGASPTPTRHGAARLVSDVV